MTRTQPKRRWGYLARPAVQRATLVLLLAGLVATSAAAAPPIRIVRGNEVPDCVTPDRLMQFLRSRNQSLSPRFAKIAHWYAYHGERWRVRWDYAFFQMALETNFLTYRRANGKWGDVNPRQNNFAGLGTTGGGVPGDSYPDVSTGVLAQLQHLIVYSGERLENPVGHRTRLKQDVILNLSEPLAARRLVTFQDLSGRWAVDKRYGRSINALASLYSQRYCGGRPDSRLARTRARTPGQRAAQPRTATQTWSTQTARTAGLNAGAARRPTAPSQTKAQTCTVSIASYGGSTTLLIEAYQGGQRQLTALDVYRDQAQVMAQSFIGAYAKGGRSIGTFKTRRAALSHAFQLCPSAAQPKGKG